MKWIKKGRGNFEGGEVLGQHMSDSGLQQIWEESGLMGPNSTERVMDGKSYAKAIRAHKLTWQALWRLLLLQINSSLETKDRDMAHRLSEAAEAQDYDTLISILGSESYVQHFNSFLNSKNDDVNRKFWWQYLHMVSILIKFVKAQREGLWDSHLDAFCAMLPLFLQVRPYKLCKVGTRVPFRNEPTSRGSGGGISARQLCSERIWQLFQSDGP
ncbi:hypothetical protein GQR58_015367 [Nymphon striatum]|nr:hypothetical protein GQR58_015367 [Nymphon striatum]